MKKGMLYRTLLFALIFACVFSTAAFPAAATSETSAPEGTTEPTASAEPTPEAEESGTSIIDSDELTSRVESFISERGINQESFSLGFCYTATGDTWYYNGDTWFYPASMYKVPLMMLLSEKVKSGELTQESEIGGLTVSTIEEYVLTYSNNDWAHTIREYLGGDAVWREEAKKYSSLEDSDYSTDYMEYCYFSSEYITDVIKTLYYNPDDYPNVINCLKQAQPNHYFRLKMEGQYDIAQKYGSYTDNRGKNYNSTCGIIYTDNPCIITVMTLDVTGYESVIADAAQLLTDYSLELDAKLAAYNDELAAAAEAEQQAAEEAQAAAEAQAQAEAEAAKAAEEQKAAEEAAALREARIMLALKLVIFAAVLVALAFAVYYFIKISPKKKRDKRYADYSRSYEAEKRAAVSSRGGYKPKH